MRIRQRQAPRRILDSQRCPEPLRFFLAPARGEGSPCRELMRAGSGRREWLDLRTRRGRIACCQGRLDDKRACIVRGSVRGVDPRQLERALWIRADVEIEARGMRSEERRV